MRLSAAIFALFALFALLSQALAQGLVPNVLSSNVDQNGRPLAGAKLFVYAANTTTPQTCYTDLGLTLPTTFPIVADNTGRIPLFYCGVGSVHIRLTDASGRLIYDYPSALVIGSTSGGGGGGGGSVDPSTVASTGDIKFRQTSETLTGWIKLNGTTIGSAASGASQRANADTSALFAYLWANCPQSHCAVTGGRGASASVDFTANKPIAVPDWRSRGPMGLDDMGSSALGANPPILSGGGDTATTPGAWGGSFNTAIAQANLPAIPASGVVTATSNPVLSGSYRPTGTVTVSGLSSAVTGTVTIGGSWRPSGTITVGGSLVPFGNVTFGNSVTPVFTTTISGSQSLGNFLTNTGGPVYSGPATATGGFTAVSVSGASFTGGTTMSPATLNTASFNPTFTGTPVPANTQVGASFLGDLVNNSSIITAGFSGSQVNGSDFATSFTGDLFNMATALTVTAGTYAFTGSNLGSGTSLATASPFLLGTWYMKL